MYNKKLRESGQMKISGEEGLQNKQASGKTDLWLSCPRACLLAREALKSGFEYPSSSALRIMVCKVINSFCKSSVFLSTET